jgi:ribosomal protein L29
VLSTLRQQAREGEVVNPTLPREVRRSCKEES